MTFNKGNFNKGRNFRDDRERRPSKRIQDNRRDHAPAEDDSGPSVLYGLNPVLEALRSGSRRVERVMIAEGAREKRFAEITDECTSRAIPFARVSREQIERLTGREATHQGVAAVVAAAEYTSVDEILDNAHDPALLLILDGIEDPRNLGAAIRVTECAGADGVIIPERRAVGLTSLAAKASAGALEFVKVAKAGNLNRLIDELKKRNIWVVGTSGDAQMSYDEWDWTRPSAVIMGSEGTGLHRLVAENCDVLVKIPMHGRIDSLNVSVAAGVVLFEARRQRNKIGAE